MHTRRCGKYKLELPVLGMGCFAYGGGDYWGAQSQGDVNEVVRRAVDQGCNFFDTAEVYNKGASESALGEALRAVPRDRCVIATKISPSNTQPGTLIEHCEASLRRLQTDYIDLYMVHWPITAHSIRHFTAENVPVPNVADAFHALMRLQQAGKIRFIGVSNFGRAKIDEALATGAQIAINELPYNLLSRAIEHEILPYCRKKEIGVLGYMALMQGVLADTYPSLADVRVWQRRTRHFDCRRTPECRHGLSGAEDETNTALQIIRSIAARHGLTMREIALKWAVAGNGITSSLVGSRNLKQLDANIKAVSVPPAPAVIEELNRATQPLMEALGPGFDYYENPANDRTR